MTTSIAAIRVAKKRLGLDYETYRAKLARITGKQSAKDMTEEERQKVLTVFRNYLLFGKSLLLHSPVPSWSGLCPVDEPPAFRSKLWYCLMDAVVLGRG